MRLPLVPPSAATRAKLERLAGELGLLKHAPVPEGDAGMLLNKAELAAIAGLAELGRAHSQRFSEPIVCGTLGVCFRVVDCVTAASMVSVLPVDGLRAMGGPRQFAQPRYATRAQSHGVAEGEAEYRRADATGCSSSPIPIDFADHAGYTSHLRRQDADRLGRDAWAYGACRTGRSWANRPPKERPGNSFIVYHGAEAKDFDLKLEIKAEWGGGSGVQYRSSTGHSAGPRGRQGRSAARSSLGDDRAAGRFLVPGERASQGVQRTALLAEHLARDRRVAGQVVQSLAGKISAVGGEHWRPGQAGSLCQRWRVEPVHDHRAGRSVSHILNGQLMAVLVDDDAASTNNVSGLIGLQIEGTPCKVSFRNIWLRKID